MTVVGRTTSGSTKIRVAVGTTRRTAASASSTISASECTLWASIELDVVIRKPSSSAMAMPRLAQSAARMARVEPPEDIDSSSRLDGADRPDAPDRPPGRDPQAPVPWEELRAREASISAQAAARFSHVPVTENLPGSSIL